ncbi:MAG: PqqD family peptide modification chaperone [Victivallaceae bacterium]|nr:PqqD family peptide modification chaperone [Victivallaceae bacterium]
MKKIPFANPEIVYREDFDDWAVLFDPDTAETYGLDETGSFIWKQINGKNSVADILQAMPAEFENISDDAGSQIEKFLGEMEEKGLIGYRK